MKISKKLRLKVINRKLSWLYKSQAKLSPFHGWDYWDEISYWETYKKGLAKGKRLEWTIDEYDGLPYLEAIDDTEITP